MNKQALASIIEEFAANIEGQRWTKTRVNYLKNQIAGLNYEDGRIAAYCEVHNYTDPDYGAFATLEAFKASLEEA